VLANKRKIVWNPSECRREPRAPRLRSVFAAALLLAVGAHAAADSAGASSSELSGGAEAPTMVVTATRTPEAALTLPVSIDRVERRRIQQGQLEVNLSESIDEVPGASVENRQNYAQDLQISVRGFGARSSFGVRGVRLYADGIPGTMPDGQGQFSQFDLGSADHIEVLRGPFSALYGNSSGGVIAIFTQDGPPGFDLGATASLGPFDTHRYALKAAGGQGNLNYTVDAAHFETDGYREHSAAERNNFNSKLRVDLNPDAGLTLIANAVETPYVGDPLGLTQAQMAVDPTQAGVNALAYDTRKNLSQEQAGIAYDQNFGADLSLSAIVYGGHRATTQFQAILQANELAKATNPGGVIDLARSFGGTDVHLTDRLGIAGTALQLTAGISYDDLDEIRRGHLNFVGQTLGVEGALRRELTDRAFDGDQYLQAQWDPSASWRLIAGARHSIVDIDSLDHLALPGTASYTAVHYEATNPVAGVTFRASPGVSLYAAYGRGFETPTLNDLAYRSVNGDPPGLNTALVPARSDNYEVGLKSELRRFTFDVAAFYTDTHDELAVLQNSGGRTVDQNIPETERRGVEAGANLSLAAGFSARLAYTWLRAQVAESYKTCILLPCPAEPQQTVGVGSRLPAVPQNSMYAALTWRANRWGLSATLETIGRARIYANDLNTQYAAGYWVDNLDLGVEQERGGWHVSEFLRADNFTDRRYADSVIVNESSGRYFEPEPGRAFYLMMTVSHR